MADPRKETIAATALDGKERDEEQKRGNCEDRNGKSSSRDEAGHGISKKEQNVPEESEILFNGLAEEEAPVSSTDGIRNVEGKPSDNNRSPENNKSQA